MLGEIHKRAGALSATGAALLLAGCIPNTGGGYRYDDPPPPPSYEPWPDQSVDPQRRPAPLSQRPVWEARPVTADARMVPTQSYTVRAGDTVRGIAAKTGASSEAIARDNDLAPPFTIHVGQRLTIPGGRYHLIREGETGIAIARAYGVRWSHVVSANYLEEPFILRTGQRLRIPTNEATASSITPSGSSSSASQSETLEQRAARFNVDIDDIVTGSSPASREGEKPAPAPVTTPRAPLSPAKPIAVPARLAGKFQWPVSGAVVRGFGPGRSGERNDGIKLAAPIGTPVHASADGVVAYVGSDIPALGGLVIINHGDGWTTVYGHASKLNVQRGQSVKRGQTVALSGNSGFADRPQLHFEMRQGRTPVDPQTRLPAR